MLFRASTMHVALVIDSRIAHINLYDGRWTLKHRVFSTSLQTRTKKCYSVENTTHIWKMTRDCIINKEAHLTRTDRQYNIHSYMLVSRIKNTNVCWLHFVTITHTSNVHIINGILTLSSYCLL